MRSELLGHGSDQVEFPRFNACVTAPVEAPLAPDGPSSGGLFNRGRHTRLEPWEFDLIASVAKQFRTHDPPELIAELSRRVLDLKSRPTSHIRCWPAYLAKFLWNKASDQIRDERRYQGMSSATDYTRPIHGSASMTVEDNFAFMELWRSFDPELQRFWLTLAQEDCNQVRTASRLRLHRNTVRHRIERIRQIG